MIRLSALDVYLYVVTLIVLFVHLFEVFNRAWSLNGILIVDKYVSFIEDINFLVLQQLFYITPMCA